MNFRGTRALIHMKNLEGNWRALSELAADSSFLCPMVKANAYGHGAVLVGQFLENSGCQQVGVATVEEGVELRQAGIEKLKILVFGPLGTSSCRALLEFRLTPVVGLFEDLLELAKLKTPLEIHLKFNTGMNRLGFSVESVDRVIELLEKTKTLEVSGVCSHLSEGENLGEENKSSARQVEIFQNLLKRFSSSTPAHLLNSSGMIASSLAKGTFHSDFGSRPGLALYGYPQLSDRSLRQAGASALVSRFRPVLELQAVLQQKLRVKKSEGVSYHSQWIAERDSLIGVLGLGYADGYSVRHSNRGSFFFEGQELPVVGRVCMDYTLLDLTDLSSEPGLGSLFTAFGPGPGPNAKALAESLGVHEYEILTQIGQRVPREVAS